jgi:hypothetical protein
MRRAPLPVLLLLTMFPYVAPAQNYYLHHLPSTIEAHPWISEHTIAEWYSLFRTNESTAELVLEDGMLQAGRDLIADERTQLKPNPAQGDKAANLWAIEVLDMASTHVNKRDYLITFGMDGDPKSYFGDANVRQLKVIDALKKYIMDQAKKWIPEHRQWEKRSLGDWFDRTPTEVKDADESGAGLSWLVELERNYGLYRILTNKYKRYAANDMPGVARMTALYDAFDNVAHNYDQDEPTTYLYAAYKQDPKQSMTECIGNFLVTKAKVPAGLS